MGSVAGRFDEGPSYEHGPGSKEKVWLGVVLRSAGSNQLDQGVEDERRVVGLWVVSRTVGHHDFSVHQLSEFVRFDFWVGEVGVGGTHHHNNRLVNAADSLAGLGM